MAETLTKEATEAIEEALNTELDSEDDVMKALTARAKDGKLPDAAQNALKGALRLLGAHKELGDVLKSATVEPEAEPETKPEVKAEPEPEPPPAAGDPVEKAHLAQLAKRDEKIDKQDKRIAELEAVAKADKVEKLVDEMDLPSMSREDQVKLIAGLNDDQREMMKAWSDGLHASMEATRPAGTPRRGETVPESASDELMKRANGLVEKDASGKLDLSDAILKVRAADPALTERCRIEALGG